MRDTTSTGYFLTGGLPSGEITAAIIFALLGLVLMTAINVRKGIMNNPTTSDTFRWKHFGWNTGLRMLLSGIITAIVIFASIRFVHELTGKTLTMFYSFGIGLGIDRATQLLTKKR